MFSNDTNPARKEATDGHDNASLKSVRTVAFSIFVPLAIAACGDLNLSASPTADSATESVANTANTETDGKDQINTNSLSTPASKLTDTSAAGIGTSAPTEKTAQATTNSTAGSSVDANADPATNESSQPENSAAATTATDSSSNADVVNSVDTIVDDMALLNDLPLIGVNLSYGFARGPGHNIMGNDPAGSNLPSWYTSSFPQSANSGYWKSIIPWFVLFEGEGNAASKSRIQMQNLKLYILSRSTNQWNLVVSEQDIGGEFCPQGSNYHQCTGGDSKRSESSGGISIMPLAGNDFHGWYGGRTAIDGADIKAVFVTMQSRLIIGDDGVDDRATARYLFDVGADYYPEMGPSENYLPGVGVSRAKLITSNWQSFNFMTFSDVGVQDPGGGITESELRANPPPLE